MAPKAKLDAETPCVLRLRGGRVTIRFRLTVFGFTTRGGVGLIFAFATGFGFTGFGLVKARFLPLDNAFAATFALAASEPFAAGLGLVAEGFFAIGLKVAAGAGAAFVVDASFAGGSGVVVLAATTFEMLAVCAPLMAAFWPDDGMKARKMVPIAKPKPTTPSSLLFASGSFFPPDAPLPFVCGVGLFTTFLGGGLRGVSFGTFLFGWGLAATTTFLPRENVLLNGREPMIRLAPVVPELLAGARAKAACLIVGLLPFDPFPVLCPEEPVKANPPAMSAAAPRTTGLYCEDTDPVGDAFTVLVKVVCGVGVCCWVADASTALWPGGPLDLVVSYRLSSAEESIVA